MHGHIRAGGSRRGAVAALANQAQDVHAKGSHSGIVTDSIVEGIRLATDDR
jgi:hypothetical protein